jgi:hypothetical protein
VRGQEAAWSIDPRPGLPALLDLMSHISLVMSLSWNNTDNLMDSKWQCLFNITIESL